MNHPVYGPDEYKEFCTPEEWKQITDLAEGLGNRDEVVNYYTEMEYGRLIDLPSDDFNIRCKTGAYFCGSTGTHEGMPFMWAGWGDPSASAHTSFCVRKKDMDRWEKLFPELMKCFVSDADYLDS